MKCFGIDVTTREQIALSFNETIVSAEPLISPVDRIPFLAPGWIDLQVNGYAGVDYNLPTADHEDIARSIRIQFSHGVTRFYPTVITGPPENMRAALRNLASAKEKLLEGQAMEGFHVEGPHISPEDGPRGAHPRQWVRPPDFEEFRRWQEAARGNIRLVTVAPEWPGCPGYIERLVREGVAVSIGHTAATAAQISDAVAAGATLSTHLGNGAHPVLPRHPNYIWEQLAEDRLSASFIADGVHLPPAFLKVAIRAKGVLRSILITDAVMPAGCSPGRYELGEREIELTSDGRVVLASENRLAGSTLRMDRGIENLMKLAGLSLIEAITMATKNPARIGRITARQRGLVPGDRADFVEFRYDEATNSIQVEKTWMSGRLVYSR
jgi:N-acetylglucosamine-6-phosphate deacetylase